MTKRTNGLPAGARAGVSFAVLCLMASVTFMAILSELVPSGILPELREGLGITEQEVGYLVGVYAIASAVAAIPVVSATITLNRKLLLMVLLVGFALSNFVVGFAPGYGVAMAGRLVGGVCAGVMWPMIAAYGMRLVPRGRQGQAVAVIMGGTTLGMSVGLPVMTAIGTNFGWRIEFHSLAVLSLVIAALGMAFIPSVAGEQRSRENSPLSIIRNPGVLLVTLMTLLAVVGNYGLYIYITLLVEQVALAGGITAALVLFGIGCLVSVVVAARMLDNHLRLLTVLMLGSGAVAFAMFLLAGRAPVVPHAAFVVWGLGFGALVALFQAAVTRQVSKGKDVATSVQSATFNLAIMIASWVGGVVLAAASLSSLLIVVATLLVAGAVIAVLARKTLAPATDDSATVHAATD